MSGIQRDRWAQRLEDPARDDECYETDHLPIEGDALLSELTAFITRAKQALTEARRPELAARCRLIVQEDGRCSLFFPNWDEDTPEYEEPEVTQFLRIDPDFGEAR